MNGVVPVKRLREKAFTGKIVLLSADLSAETRAAYLALRVDLMIPKPFDVHALRAAISQIGSGTPIAIEPDPGSLRSRDVYELLRLGLDEPEAPSELQSPSHEEEDMAGGA
jgi:DNA-binding response OmpR family regulator